MSKHMTNSELADYLLGLAVITRIGAEKQIGDLFNATATIEALREAAARLRGIDSAQGVHTPYEIAKALEDLNKYRSAVRKPDIGPLRPDPGQWFDAKLANPNGGRYVTTGDILTGKPSNPSGT